MVELSFFNLGRFFDLENKFIYFFNQKFGRIDLESIFFEVENVSSGND